MHTCGFTKPIFKNLLENIKTINSRIMKITFKVSLEYRKMFKANTNHHFIVYNYQYIIDFHFLLTYISDCNDDHGRM